MLLLLLKKEKLFFLNESKFSVMDKKLLNLFKFFEFWSFIAFQNSNVGIWISYVFNQIYLILKRNLTNVEYTVYLYLRYFNIIWCIDYVDNFGHSLHYVIFYDRDTLQKRECRWHSLTVVFYDRYELPRGLSLHLLLQLAASDHLSVKLIPGHHTSHTCHLQVSIHSVLDNAIHSLLRDNKQSRNQAAIESHQTYFACAATRFYLWSSKFLISIIRTHNTRLLRNWIIRLEFHGMTTRLILNTCIQQLPQFCKVQYIMCDFRYILYVLIIWQVIAVLYQVKLRDYVMLNNPNLLDMACKYISHYYH